MDKARLEAFSDGVFAIIITVMVLALNAPDGTGISALAPRISIFLTYVLSFLYVSIFWINHHLLLSATRRISPAVLWGNINFLFWMSLVPFFTSWVDEHHADMVPVMAYGIIFLMCVVSFRILQWTLFRTHDADAPIVRLLRPGQRSKISIAGFVVAILMAAVHPYISLGIYVAIAGLWLVPNKPLVRAIGDGDVCGQNKNGA